MNLLLSDDDLLWTPQIPSSKRLDPEYVHWLMNLQFPSTAKPDPAIPVAPASPVAKRAASPPAAAIPTPKRHRVGSPSSAHPRAPPKPPPPPPPPPAHPATAAAPTPMSKRERLLSRSRVLPRTQYVFVGREDAAPFQLGRERKGMPWTQATIRWIDRAELDEKAYLDEMAAIRMGQGLRPSGPVHLRNGSEGKDAQDEEGDGDEKDDDENADEDGDGDGDADVGTKPHLMGTGADKRKQVIAISDRSSDSDSDTSGEITFVDMARFRNPPRSPPLVHRVSKAKREKEAREATERAAEAAKEAKAARRREKAKERAKSRGKADEGEEKAKWGQDKSKDKGKDKDDGDKHTPKRARKESKPSISTSTSTPSSASRPAFGGRGWPEAQDRALWAAMIKYGEGKNWPAVLEAVNAVGPAKTQSECRKKWAREKAKTFGK